MIQALLQVAKKHGANKKGLARVDPLLRKSAAPKENKTSLNNMLMQLRKVTPTQPIRV